MTTPEKRMQLAREQRYVCSWRHGDQGRLCGARASHQAKDVERGDAIVFYCARHFPPGAAPIVEGTPYIAIELAAVLTVGGTTMSVQDAIAAAKTICDQVLTAAGIRWTLVGTTAGVLAPRIHAIADSDHSDGQTGVGTSRRLVEP